MNARYLLSPIAVLSLLVGTAFALNQTPLPPDSIVIADFEGDDYAGWKATGTAFGTKPARGTLPGQMHLDGFVGHGLVTSFVGGDSSVGTLTSPPFTIGRKQINLLVGGGKFPGATCVDLLINGRTVRSATGPNDQPGGLERLGWTSWDVAEFRGKEATIQIVDNRREFWGHINVDQILQSDERLQAEPARRQLIISSTYLHLPIKTGAPKRRMKFVVDGRTVREFEIELSDGPADFLVFDDVSEFRGRNLAIEVDALPSGSAGLAAIVLTDALPDPSNLYRERFRPQFHFTSRRGWLNDPNGLVYQDGVYHLFYQHNPYGREWGNMHWGHAVSPDLIHWKEEPISLRPRQFGDWAFSGSAIVDNGSLVAAYTSTGRGECLIRSRDAGRTWSEFSGNPLLKHEGRDPKLVRFEPTDRWIMAVYDEAPGRRSIAFHDSKDLQSWNYLSRIDDFFECPDLFELPIDGDSKQTRWVLHAADGRYLLGRFDGKEFQNESGKHQVWSGNFYAAQSYSNVPGGRRIQVGWAQGTKFPGMPFNQQMTIPVDLTLRTTPDGVRMFAEPVREVETLVRSTHRLPDQSIKGLGLPISEASGDLHAIRMEIEPGAGTTSGIVIRGARVSYDVKAREVRCGSFSAPLIPVDGRVSLQILVDRASIEIFGNGGRIALSVGVVPGDEDRLIRLFSDGGASRFGSIRIDNLGSIWNQ